LNVEDLAIDCAQKISCSDELGDVYHVAQDCACKTLGFSHPFKWRVLTMIMDASKPFLSFIVWDGLVVKLPHWTHQLHQDG
jgi:hypothetical protein